MIVCIWYPSGGFGHFINAVLSLYGQDFIRPKKNILEFSVNGNSHELDLVAPKWFHDPEHYEFLFDQPGNYSVLVDNGINNEGIEFLEYFSTANIIKICYSDFSWPIVARTMIEKALEVPLDNEVTINLENWPSTDTWAYQEKYFLYLRDHKLRQAWKPNSLYHSLLIDDLLTYKNLQNRLTSFELCTDNFESVWKNWYASNSVYINPVIEAKKIINAIQINQDLKLDYITDIWTRAVIYYYIWLEYNFEVPHNDYSDWFTNTKDIVTMLKKYGVVIDKN